MRCELCVVAAIRATGYKLQAARHRGNCKLLTANRQLKASLELCAASRRGDQALATSFRLHAIGATANC